MSSPVISALERAQGYMDLGLFDDAWCELGSLSRSEQEQVESLHLRAALLMQQRRWEEALLVSRRICDLQPGVSGGYIQAAYCLHELGRTGEACHVLRTGPASLQQEPIYHYNLSCYEVYLGKLEDARALLARSFELDERLVVIAEHDPDLSPLWASL
jgi:Flp pilus assembly protein TadD